MPDERVLRWIKSTPVYCPTCNAQVTGYTVVPEEFWTLKPEYQGMAGLPVGPEFGDRHVARMDITLEPCGHQVDKLEIVTPPKQPDPLSLIELDGLYEASIQCVGCGERIKGVGFVSITLDDLLKAAREHLKDCKR